MMEASKEFHDKREALMAELAKRCRSPENDSSTKVMTANEQLYCPAAITKETTIDSPNTNHPEQFSTTATTPTAQLDATALDREEKFKLLASLSIPILTKPVPGSRFDIGGAMRGNLLRQLTEYMESNGESPKYESKNSVYEHNLIDFAKRKNSTSIDVKHGMKKLMSLSDSQTQAVVDQLVNFLSALGAPERCSKAESGEPEVPPIPYTGFGPKWANSVLQETT